MMWLHHVLSFEISSLVRLKFEISQIHYSYATAPASAKNHIIDSPPCR